jgi:hypothetical protein
MLSATDRTFPAAMPVARVSSGFVEVPLLGVLWVIANVGLGGLGIYIDWPIRCAFVAGLINGTLLAVIAVATASDRFQAGTAGMLGGLTLSSLRSDGSMVWKATQGIHSFIDGASRAMGFEIDEKMHRAIQQEALYMVWTIVFVVLASLVAEWVRAVRSKA